MKNYIFKKQGIVVKAKSERQAREIYNQYLHDSSDLGVAEFLKSKGIKFSKIDGTKGNIVIKFDNEKDWALGSKYLRTKYGKKGYESIKEGNSYKVILGDYIIQDADFYGANQGSEKADDILFALQVMYGEPMYSYNDFRKMNLSQAEVNEAITYVKKKRYDKYSFFEKRKLR